MYRFLGELEKGEKRPSGLQLLLQQPPPRPPYPWLMYYYVDVDGSYRNETFCRISTSSSGPVSCSSECIRLLPPKLQDHHLPVSYSHGWLLIFRRVNLGFLGNHDYYFLWNPTTLVSIDLPPLLKKPSWMREQLKIGDYLLSSSPIDPNCLVLLFSKEDRCIIYCRPGRDKDWSVWDYGLSMRSTSMGSYSLSNPVSCGGKIYAAGYENMNLHLLLISLAEDESNNKLSLSLSMVKRDGPDRCYLLSSYLKKYLVESGDELFSIVYNRDEWGMYIPLGFEVNKFNFSTHEWEKVKSFNGRSVFLGAYYSLSCPIDDPEAGSCIYLTTANQDVSLCKYNIEDESIAVYFLCSNPIPCHIHFRYIPIPPYLDYYFLTWIMPPQRVGYIRGKENAADFEEKEDNIRSIEENTKEANLSDLPQDMLPAIARHLISFVDYLNFRCVNWFCASMRLQTNSFSPCLVFFERAKGVYSFVDSKLNCKHSLAIPKELEHHMIRYYKDGWLLLQRGKTLAFFNILTAEVIRVDAIDAFENYIFNNFSIKSFIFTSLPTSPDCVIIGLSCSDAQAFVYVIKPGESLSYSYDFIEDDWYDLNCSSPVFFEGSFYYLCIDGSLGVLEFEDRTRYENASWKVIEEHQELFRIEDLSQKYLIECNGELLFVFVGAGGRWVALGKFDWDRQVWGNVKTLGRYSLYISRSSSFSAIAKEPAAANRIYFPLFYRESMIYYSLDTWKFHYVGGESSLKNLYDTLELLDCAWMELPSCRA